MSTMSLSEAKMKLSELVDRVHRLDERVIITRNGSPVAVLVSTAEVESYDETAAIEADADLRKEVDQGLKALESRPKKLYTLEELFED